MRIVMDDRLQRGADVAEHLADLSFAVGQAPLWKIDCASSAKSFEDRPAARGHAATSKAFRYSIATDFRCSSVIVWVVSAMPLLMSAAPRRRAVAAIGAEGRYQKERASAFLPVEGTEKAVSVATSRSGILSTIKAPDRLPSVSTSAQFGERRKSS